MGVLARASRAELCDALEQLEDIPAFEEVRRPETGLVMLRGRIAGTGAPFNLGEATVTRAVVRLASGETGFSYVLGRDDDKARIAALIDALWSIEARQPEVERKVLSPLRAGQIERDRAEAERTAATKVDFFTMVRGEDPVP